VWVSKKRWAELLASIQEAVNIQNDALQKALDSNEQFVGKILANEQAWKDAYYKVYNDRSQIVTEIVGAHFSGEKSFAKIQQELGSGEYFEY
jgi:hypothetical protein